MEKLPIDSDIKEEKNEETLKEILINRLAKRGIESCLISGFIRVPANNIFDDVFLSVYKVNKRLNHLGWYDVELDYHTLQLGAVCFEKEDLCNYGYISPTHSNGFASTFESKRKKGGQ